MDSPSQAQALDASARALVRVSAALAAAGADAGGPALGEALEAAVGCTRAGEVEEALLQSYLFLGYPAALNALARWREMWGAPDRPLPPREEEDGGRWLARGEDVCRRVYGGQYDGLRENIRALHPAMERWMVEEGYGRVLGRAGLALPVRELCIVAVLTVSGAPAQLYSHMRGALNTGASVAEVEEALEIALEHTPAERRDTGRETWRRVLDRRHGRNPD